MTTSVVQLISPPLLLEYYEAKIQWHIVLFSYFVFFFFFHGKQHLKYRGIFITVYIEEL